MPKPTATTKKTLALFWHFTRSYKFLFWYATLGSIIAIVFSSVLPPLIISLAFNKLQALYTHHQAINFIVMKDYIIAYATVNICSLILWRSQAYSTWKYIILVKKKMTDYIFNHLQQMDSKFHADRFGGALVSQTNKFINAYEQFMGEFNWNILTGIVAFSASLVILAVTNLFYAGIFLLFIIIYFFIIYRQMRRQMPYSRALSSAESLNTAKLADTMSNMMAVRAFAGEEFEAKLFDRQTTKTMNKNLRLMRVQIKSEIWSQGSTELIQIIAFLSGIVGISFLHLPIGVLYLTVTYTLDLSERLWNFMFILRNLNHQFGDAADMTDILNISSAIQDPINPEKSKIHRGDIQFTDVSFAYPENPKESLFNHLSLKIKAGEKVGLVGQSGGGKTTITKLILRFMDIQSGVISIDGQDITKISQRDLRRQISYVSQDPILFHRSFIQNISYGANYIANQEAVEAAAKMANAHEFIMQLPKGYQTLVGERGVKLSGGQRQRVVIARAMLKNAPILILDEATSALDSESEVLIQEALWRLMQNKTAIVIAHRLSTIQKMDRIIVLKEGKIVEEGSHKELLQARGNYATLWDHQSGGFLTEAGGE